MKNLLGSKPRRQKAIRLALEGMTMKDIAGELGIDRTTIYRHMERDPEFRGAISHARDIAIDRKGIKAVNAVEKHIDDWLEGEPVEVRTVDKDGNVSFVYKPVELSPQLAQLALRAYDIRYGQTRREVDVTETLQGALEELDEQDAAEAEAQG